MVQKTSCFVSSYDPVGKSSALLIRSLQIVMRLSHWSWARTRGTMCWVTCDLFRSSVRILKHAPWLTPTVAARSSTDWERLAFTNIITSSILRSVRIVYGRLVRTSFAKQTLPCEKWLCHLNTILRLNALSPWTCCIIWNVSVAVLSNFWENFMFVRCSNCDTQVQTRAFKSPPSQQRPQVRLQCMHSTVSCWNERLTRNHTRRHLLYVL